MCERMESHLRKVRSMPEMLEPATMPLSASGLTGMSVELNYADGTLLKTHQRGDKLGIDIGIAGFY